MANVVKKVILRHINILRWMPKYQKIDVISDMVAGITLGLTMMPQSLAYAALAGVPPQYGLYTAFMGSFAYIFFGTIKEVSIGPTSLLSLLIFSYTDGLNIDHVILLSFLSGWFVFFMGVFKLGLCILSLVEITMSYWRKFSRLFGRFYINACNISIYFSNFYYNRF